MSRLPIVSGKEAIKVFKKLGYKLDHQTGSHIILRNESPPNRRLTIPNHNEIARGTLRSILRQAGVSPDQFRKLL